MKTDLVAFGAHPDDTELGCGGTLIKLTDEGKKVVVVDLTGGEMGTRGSVGTRHIEASKAGDVQGLLARDNLGLPDSELVNSREFQLPIIERVRYYRPHICLICAPADRHPDHGHASTLLIDALFFSGLRKIETFGPDRKPQKPHRPYHILHYMQFQPFEPDLVIDITDTIDRKEDAIRSFSSQFNVSEPGDQPATVISDPDFFKSLRARARHFGMLAGFTYGEAFKYVRKPIPFNSLEPLFSTSPGR
ncbi:MAG: bacillithiol biosynthesis deacetylase BshB1 [Balneolaceae bacterium]